MKKWQCSICGYIHVGEAPPEECPVCGAEASAFIEITEEAEQPAAESSLAGQIESSPDEPSQQTTMGKIPSMILRFHLHPITVHTPNGIIPMAFLFLLIATIFNNLTFEQAAFYSLVFVLLNMPMVLYTGYVTWQNKYKGALTSVFKIKIGASLVTISMLCILVIWRIASPDLFATGGTAMIIYILLALVLVVAVGIAGQMGGKLVFKSGQQ